MPKLDRICKADVIRKSSETQLLILSLGTTLASAEFLQTIRYESCYTLSCDLPAGDFKFSI